jgi:hypothetical protein
MSANCRSVGILGGVLSAFLSRIIGWCFTAGGAPGEPR